MVCGAVRNGIGHTFTAIIKYCCVAGVVAARNDHQALFRGRSCRRCRRRRWRCIITTTTTAAASSGTTPHGRQRSARHGCVRKTWCARRDHIPRCRRRRARVTPAAGGPAQYSVRWVGGSSGHQMRGGVHVFYVHVQEEADGIS